LTDISRFIGIEVIPETVGQFTGLCDKNGKEIYRGDILGVKGKIIGHVKDGVRGYCYDVVYAMPLREKGCSLYHTVKYDYPNSIEVIGNIHDNRDLLTIKQEKIIMVLREFLKKYSDYSNFEIEFQQNQDISNFDFGKAVDEEYFPEALQNFADRICEEQRMICGRKVLKNHAEGMETYPIHVQVAERPKIKEL
jgi:hypothetical protein